jgi:xanthine dehydrogenase molybdopterin-binding subunit B
VKADDIPGKNSVTVDGVDVRVLASGEVRYYGEPIVLLAGKDEEELETLAGDVVVEYEEEEPYLSFEMPREDRIVLCREIERGRPDAAFKEAEKVVSTDVSTGIQEHFYSEPHAAYAAWENDVSTLRVTCSTQWPHHVHRTIAEVLAVPSEIVAVAVPEEPDLALDGKLWYPSLIAAHAALVAWLTKKNVKLAASREEDFLYSPKRAPVDFKLRGGIDQEGRLLVLEATILVNMGPTPFSPGKSSIGRYSASWAGIPAPTSGSGLSPSSLTCLRSGPFPAWARPQASSRRRSFPKSFERPRKYLLSLGRRRI